VNAEFSAFLRTAALGKDLDQKKTERLALLSELTRARNMLNQIARNSEQGSLIDQIQIVAGLISVEKKTEAFCDENPNVNRILTLWERGAAARSSIT